MFRMIKYLKIAILWFSMLNTTQANVSCSD